jgi:hypothetical protein
MAQTVAVDPARVVTGPPTGAMSSEQASATFVFQTMVTECGVRS